MMQRLLFATLCCGLIAASAHAQDMTYQRLILGNGEYTPGQNLTIRLTINYSGSGTLFSMGHREFLPVGWDFVGVTGGSAAPNFENPNEAQSLIEFVWTSIPQFPGTVEYAVAVPGGESGPKDFMGQVLYRETGPELQSPNVTTTVYALGETPEKENAMCGCAPSGGGSANILGDGIIALILCGILLFSRQGRTIPVRTR